MAGGRPGGKNPEGRARAGAAGTCEAACGEDGAVTRDTLGVCTVVVYLFYASCA